MRHRFWKAAALASCVTLAGSGCGSGAAAPLPDSPPPTSLHTSAIAGLPARAIVTAALHAARSEGSVHVHLESGALGGYVQEDDSGEGVGTQVIHASSLRMTVRIVGETAYVKVFHTGGEYFVGMAGVQASRYLNRWITLRPGDKSYRAVSAGATMESLLSLMKPKGVLSKAGTSVIDGKPVVGVWGGYLGSRGCLYISAAGKPLPVRLTVTNVDGTDVTITFGDWGERVQVTAPRGAIPAASLVG
jgi:hypothetical protein